MEAMAAMEVVATEGAGMATSREEEAMEVADMGAMEAVGDTVDTEGVVEGMEAMQGVDMEAMAAAEEEEGGVMMMVSMLACQPDVWLLSVAPFRFIIHSFLATAGYGGSRYGGPVRSQYQQSYHPHPYNRT